MESRNASARPRHAAYAAEGFTLDNRSPEPRAYRAWDFYYKHCTLVSRNPWPTRDEYDCSDPE